MPKKILLHSCCAPCTTYVYKWLKDNGYEVTSYFSNPNIHPLDEFDKRLETMRQYADQVGLELILPDNYDQTAASYSQQVGALFGDERCYSCYKLRLDEVARFAAKNKFDAFCTTLLISPYQKHELIKQAGLVFEKEIDIPFFYEDFRVGFEISRQMAKDMGLYRQKYCGCDWSIHAK